MKLKLYRISLIILLLASFVITLIFGIKTTISVLKFDKEKLMDGIIYILCFVMLLMFTAMEVINTILSFKNGSVYIKGLAFNDNNTLNRNSLIVTGGIASLSIFAIYYISIILRGRNLPLYKLEIEAKHFMLVSFILVLINAIAVLLFPIFGKDDQAFNDKKK